MKRKIKSLVALLLVSVIGVSEAIPAHASFMDAYEDTWHIAGYSEKMGSTLPSIIKIKASSDVWTSTPVFWKHKLTSDGTSTGALKYKLGGYYYKIPSNGHKITATVSGVSVDISATDFANLSSTDKSITIATDGYTITYDFEVECINLVGYKEKHVFYMGAYKTSDKKNPQETIIVSTTATLY